MIKKYFIINMMYFEVVQALGFSQLAVLTTVIELNAIKSFTTCVDEAPEREYLS